MRASTITLTFLLLTTGCQLEELLGLSSNDSGSIPGNELTQSGGLSPEDAAKLYDNSAHSDLITSHGYNPYHAVFIAHEFSYSIPANQVDQSTGEEIRAWNPNEGRRIQTTVDVMWQLNSTYPPTSYREGIIETQSKREYHLLEATRAQIDFNATELDSVYVNDELVQMSNHATTNEFTATLIDSELGKITIESTTIREHCDAKIIRNSISYLVECPSPHPYYTTHQAEIIVTMENGDAINASVTYYTCSREDCESEQQFISYDIVTPLTTLSFVEHEEVSKYIVWSDDK
ncbi:MAG: hypothetical protein OEZ43_15535 [Gammaproteobacteria bacterium]|nr:hypothetical protein [Gammaproteobacteria bacterium]